MASYLLTISLGPVQSLIGAARRTRDLWCGSWLLNEAAKAAAAVFQTAQPGCLIFPCPTTPSELEIQDHWHDDDANIANIIRAQMELPDDGAVRALCEKARGAASDRLAALCEQARARLPQLPFHETLWAAQKHDMLETFTAWVRIGDTDTDTDTAYADASRRLGELLAARKTTRDFLPAASTSDGPGFGVPKSSLDGARESVINLPRREREGRRYKTALRKLGMNQGEELDALALAKRMAGDIDQFTAYSRIAADPWLQALSLQQLKALGDAYEPLVSLDLATRVKGNGGIFDALAFDAQLVFAFRLDNALAANDMDPEDRQALEALRKSLGAIKEKPVPYAVILKADGDRMGELLSQAASAEESRAISRALHSFAKSVRCIVRRHRGHAVYAGGDDVLAMLPLENAVACAQELATTFQQTMREAAVKLSQPPEHFPTLSVGLGIGHLVEPLGTLRARADAAESLAKGNRTERPRNALAIQLGIRSGGEHTWRGCWDDAAGLAALARFCVEYRNLCCPSRLGYELRSVVQRLAWVQCTQEKLPGIHEAELVRSLSRARKQGGQESLSDDFASFLLTRAQTVGLSQLADELIITRWLAARTQSDIGALE
ncbi:type III-B CRISPR-associated protein Cas10/Cmr2 [Azonexus sp.]|uniref:type III-B CRISPR-associated protein Cas10/Cmr2 n=1 Tax=Azonexus sp. TaxID=1872668 RepID=UPI0035AFF22D